MVYMRNAGRPAVRKYVRKAGPVVKRLSAKQVELQLAAKVQRLEKSMRARKPEEKFVDVSLSLINVSDTVGAVQQLTVIAAGTDFNQRVGDTVRIHRICGHFRVATGTGSLGAVPLGEEFISASIVVDGQQVGDTDPTAAAVFAATFPPTVLLNEAISHKRFRILDTSPLFEAARIATSTAPTGSTLGICPTQSPVWYFDIPVDIRSSFNGTASSDIEKNGIYIVARSSLTADTVDCDGRARVYYTDC